MHIGGNMLRNVYSERLSGFKKALANNNIEFTKDLLFITDMSEKDAIEVAGKILRMKPRPDGVFASNDTTAVSIIVELEKAGVAVPGDIAVVGFNNDPISRVVKPNLTTIHYPAKEMGEVAAASLIGLLKNSQVSSLSTIVLKHNLIIRNSSIKQISHNS